MAATNIDILDGVLKGAIGLGDGALKGVEVHHQQVDGRDALFIHHRFIETAPAQEAAMNFRVQCFDAAGHDFRKAGVVRHLRHGESGLAQDFGRATRGE